MKVQYSKKGAALMLDADDIDLMARGIPCAAIRRVLYNGAEYVLEINSTMRKPEEINDEIRDNI